jgi:hypothetical protein
VLGFQVFAANEEKKRKEKIYKQMLLLKNKSYFEKFGRLWTIINAKQGPRGIRVEHSKRGLKPR